MISRLISGATGIIYRHVVKPLLFRSHPDAVHANLVRRGKMVQRLPIVKLLPGFWSYQNHSMLSQILHGVTYRSPVGLSAGFDKNCELVPLIRRVGFGFMTGGSVTFHSADGNPRPWFHRLPEAQSLVVNAGLPSEGIDSIITRLGKYPLGLVEGFPLVISVAKTNSVETVSDQDAINDYINSLRRLENVAQVAQYEINISCPNTYGGEPFTTPEKLDALLSAIDGLDLARPVFIKMPIDLEWPAFRELLLTAKNHRVAGVTIGNLRKNRQNINSTVPEDVKGNLSGAPTREITTELIRQTYAEFGDYLTIIGVGGIFSADHAYEKIKAGASLVELITGMIFEGPQVVGQINRDLCKLLRRDGYASIAEAVGADHRKT